MTKLISTLRSLPWITLFVSMIAILISWVDQLSAGSLFQWERATFVNGEPWRVLTGHLTHWTGLQLATGLGVFLVFGAIVESHSKWLLVGTLGLTTGFAHLLHFAFSNLDSYRGLSSWDTALVLVAIALFVREQWISRSKKGVVFGLLALIVLVVKVVREVFVSVPFVSSTLTEGTVVSANSHFAGIIGGALALLIGYLLKSGLAKEDKLVGVLGKG